MAKHLIPITNGKGSKTLTNGTYTVEAEVLGYDNASIDPTSIEIQEGNNSYTLQIAATGTLTLHVTEDGTSTGTPVVGATFIRTDSLGNEYGNIITTDQTGNAIFNNVPYADANAPIIYFKQTASDGDHEFDSSIQNTTMTQSTFTLEIQNVKGALRTINLTDANYNNLKIDSGSLTLTN